MPPAPPRFRTHTARWLLLAAAAASLSAVRAQPAGDLAQGNATHTPASDPGTFHRLAIQWHDATPTNAPATLLLNGRGARQQVLVTATAADSSDVDLTRDASYTVSPNGVAAVSASGLITAQTDGTALVRARLTSGLEATLQVVITNSARAVPVHFANQIVPILTKLGCNAGGCHGKAAGQNGFRLSLLGFEPAEDYEHLAKEARGRRVLLAAPEQSLLLLKATGDLPHGGGKRLEPGSRDYELLARWIAQGLPRGGTNDPVVTRIEVYPSQRVLRAGQRQQLLVTAHYSDGAVEDVTASAQYETNDKELADADAHGLVNATGRAGDVAVMVRYASQVGVFRAVIPMGVPVAVAQKPRSFVDELVLAKLKAVGMPPSDPCDDSTFFRRVTLDIAGRLPTATESREFLADKDPTKRDRWIDQLLESGDYADHFANKWSALLRNKRATDTHARGSYAFHAWIRDSLLENKPYDQFVGELLTAAGDVTQNPAVVWYRQVRDTTGQLEDTAQLFLGTRLRCAQCHHHPYEKWSQHDYYSFGAFFAQLGRKGGERPGDEAVFHRRGIAAAVNKKNNQQVKPAPLGLPPLDLGAETDPRQALVDWMRRDDNPRFAHALVNRYWKHFFGRALVEPEDDLRDTNPATNPELLEALAQHFIRSGFDLKGLVRLLCQSQTYQLSATPNAHNTMDRQYYARFYPRRLAAEVLLDAVDTATGNQTSFPGTLAGTRAVQLPDNSFNAGSYFLTVFGRPEASSACECERSQEASLSQSLHLLNSKELQAKLSATDGRSARLARRPAGEFDDGMDELCLALLSRPPTSAERTAARAHLERRVGAKTEAAATEAKRREAFEDIVWALINTKEFLFNH
jgi:hypothetical protein